MKTALFACVHNAGRSQMAAAWFNALADAGKARGISAGTAPGERVHPEVVSVMKEAGIDLRRRGAQAALGRARGLRVASWSRSAVAEPARSSPACASRTGRWDCKGQPIARVREIRDEIRARVEALIRAESWEGTGG